jgi:putative PIN family toxin of toxin-antitoxin system
MHPNAPLRIILDTNLWISYLISKRLRRIDDLFEESGVTLIFSEELMSEFLEVARRPKFNKFFSSADLENLLDLFDMYGEWVQVTSVIDLCRDAKDNFLLALAKDGNADYLISGDEDLLIIQKFGDTEILTYTEFELKLLE